MARLHTAAGEKINADKHISSLVDAAAGCCRYAKTHP
jgi:hypothetical protein